MVAEQTQSGPLSIRRACEYIKNTNETLLGPPTAFLHGTNVTTTRLLEITNRAARVPFS